MTAPSPRQVLDQLTALREACTPAGKWTVERVFVKRQPDGWHREILDHAGTVALLSSDSDGAGIDGGTSTERAALIVAAVNHLPALLAVARGVLDLADEWAGRYPDYDTRDKAEYAREYAARLRAVVTAALASGDGQ